MSYSTVVAHINIQKGESLFCGYDVITFYVVAMLDTYIIN